MLIKKEDLWKYEKPIYSKKVYITSDGHINFNRRINELRLNKNSILLFTFKHSRGMSFICKVIESNPYDYSIHLGIKIFNEAKLEKNKYYNMEIIQKKNFKQNKEFNVVKIKDGKLDLVSLLGENQIYFERPYDWITIYSFPRKQLTLLRYIELNNDLIWSIGFYLAEGTKKQPPFKIANNELNLLKKFKEIIEKNFGINKWYIENARNKSADLRLIKKHISENLCNADIRFYISKQRERYKFGLTTLTIPDRIFFRVFNPLLESEIIHSFIYRDKDRILSFLRGFEAGDGFVSLRNWKDNSKKMITVGAELKDKKLLLLVNRYYESLYGKTRKETRQRNGRTYHRIYYEDCKILRELIINNHFLDHKERRERLVYGYSKKRFGESDFRYLDAIINGKTTHKQIRQYFNYTYSGGYNKLELMTKNNLLRKEKAHGKYNYYLTKRGEILYKELLRFNYQYEK